MSNPAQGAVGAETMTDGETVTILYTNWRGETAVRRIVPGSEYPGFGALWLGETEWHPGIQWLLAARDVEKDAHRVFALSGIKAWGQAAVDAALATSRTDSDEGTAGEAAADRVCHDEQLRIWSAEITGRISVGGYLPEDLSYDDGVRLDADIRDEIKRIVISAFSHPELSPAPATPPGVPDSVREALAEVSNAVSLAHNDYMRLGDYGGWDRLNAAECRLREMIEAISAHPAGQSTGQGAASALTAPEAECEESYQIGKRDGYDEGVQDAALRAGLDGEYRASSDPDRHVPDATTMLERIAERVDGLEVSLERATKPAPDSPLTGPAGVNHAMLARELMGFHHALDGGVGDGAIIIRCESETEQTRLALRAVLREAAAIVSAARPAAPEAQGAWRVRAATEIDAIAQQWGTEGDADGRAYAKTLAAILRAEQPAPPSSGQGGR